MKKSIIAAALALASTLAAANCTFHTVYVNGRYVTYTTCCYAGGQCFTTVR